MYRCEFVFLQFNYLNVMNVSENVAMNISIEIMDIHDIGQIGIIE